MIRFNYVPTFEDYTRFNRHVMIRKLMRLSILLVALIATLIFFVGQLTQSEQPKNLNSDYIFGMCLEYTPLAIYIPLVYVLAYRGIKRQWNRCPELRSDRVFEFDDEGIKATADGLYSSIAWRHFESVELSGELILIKMFQPFYFYFPIKAVPDVAGLVALLKKHIPKNADLNRISVG